MVLTCLRCIKNRIDHGWSTVTFFHILLYHIGIYINKSDMIIYANVERTPPTMGTEKTLIDRGWDQRCQITLSLSTFILYRWVIVNGENWTEIRLPCVFRFNIQLIILIKRRKKSQFFLIRSYLERKRSKDSEYILYIVWAQCTTFNCYYYYYYFGHYCRTNSKWR